MLRQVRNAAFSSLLLVCLLGLSGCESLRFYGQAIVGQSKLLLSRQSIQSLLDAGDTEPVLRYRLQLSMEILEFAAGYGLESNGAYESYVETGEPFVIWNVFAAERYQLVLRTHCFPVAGCVSYRGFFSPEDARRYADRMAGEGYDVYVGGVRAYSTLGWFDDPLLDTFLFISEEQLAALLFHELAHQVAYAPGDTRFNESMATAIERHLLQLWLEAREQAGYYEDYLAQVERHGQVLALIDNTREQLRALYASGVPAPDMETGKQSIIADMKTRYTTLSEDWPEPRPFEGWMNGTLNNARLETVTDYHGWVPAMTRYINQHGLDSSRQELVRLATLDYPTRTRILESW